VPEQIGKASVKAFANCQGRNAATTLSECVTTIQINLKGFATRRERVHLGIAGSALNQNINARRLPGLAFLTRVIVF